MSSTYKLRIGQDNWNNIKFNQYDETQVERKINNITNQLKDVVSKADTLESKVSLVDNEEYIIQDYDF